MCSVEYWAGDEVMDPEMAAAFEVFLAESSPASSATQSHNNTSATHCNDVSPQFQHWSIDIDQLTFL